LDDFEFRLALSQTIREATTMMALRQGSVQLCTVTAFEWDPRKAASNLRKHGIRFADSIGVLEDVRAITLRDDSHGEDWA